MKAFPLSTTNRGLEAVNRKNIIIQRYLLGLLLLCLFALPSCASTGGTARIYEGPELPKEKTAVLNFASAYLKIYELNGKKSFDDGRKLFQGSHYRFIILPGRNSLEFMIAPSGYTGPDRCYKADFDAVAGKDYLLSCIYTKYPGVTLGNKTITQLTVDEIFIKDVTGNESLLNSKDAESLRSAPSVDSALIEVECPYRSKK